MDRAPTKGALAIEGDTGATPLAVEVNATCTVRPLCESEEGWSAAAQGVRSYGAMSERAGTSKP